MTRPVDNIWTCDCGKRGVPAEIGGALFDFQYVCKDCVKNDNLLFAQGQIPKPIWIEDPSAIVEIER